MLQQIVHILLISCICCAWGLPPLLLFKRNIPADNRWYRSWLSFFAFLFLLGCIVLSMLASWAYLLVPMKFGGLMIATLLQLPLTLILGRKKIRSVIPSPLNTPTQLKGVAGLFFVVCLCLFVLLSCLPTSSRDTQIYHLQIISWATRFPAVPGVANLFPRLGLGSNWFDLIALFHIPAWSANSFSYLNAALTIWFFIWLFCRFQYHYQKIASSPGSSVLCLLYFLVLAYSLLDWELLRDTANSTDYDTIVTACLFLAIDSWLEGSADPNDTMGFSALFTMIMLAAIGFKLSGIFVIIPLSYYLLRRPSLRHILFTSLLGGFIVIPVLLKNYIVSGYPLFPLSVHFTSPDWQMPKGMVDMLRNYITLSNRFYNQSFDNSPAFGHQHHYWVLSWARSILWQHQLLMALTLSSVSLFIFRPQGLGNPVRFRVLLFLLLFMAAAWFLTAPSPRFGYGILLFTAFLPVSIFLAPRIRTSWYRYGLLLGSAFVLTYLPAKFRAFTISPSCWLYPQSTPVQPYTTVSVNGASYHLPEKTDPANRMCGFTDLPCIGAENPYLSQRSASLRDGFRFSTLPDSVFILHYNY